jgi:uncharacterized repeat protein (TIGR03803 family)
MQSTRSSSILLIVSVVATLLIWLPSAQSAPKYSVLHAFGKGKDGAGLWGSLLLDRKGNVYGTTTAGGSYGGGIVFELTSKTHGKWTETILHNFDGSDGDGSDGALLFDPAGNLYGTTTRGGAHGYGTVFELTPESGDWMETILHSFDPNDKGGCCPYAGIVIDASSNLYGTTGAVFKLSLSPGGWTETILHDFTCRHDDGCEPFSGVIRDGAGNLFGTTEHGGSSKNCDAGCGIVYQVKPMSGGKWRETIVHSFGGSGDGAFPGVGALTLDQSGNVYGTTDVGGPAGYGTVFKLTPKANGRWKETILHSFPKAQMETTSARAWCLTGRAISTAPPLPAEHNAIAA